MQSSVLGNIDKKTFDTEKIKLYAKALADLEPAHRALLLHTQGLTTAQIKETLALTNSLKTKEKLTLAEQTLAMANAGLLKETTKLTAAELQENLQSTFGHDADVKELATKMGLVPVIDKQGDEVYELSAAKLAELSVSKELNEELVKEFGLRSGLNVSSHLEKGVDLVESLKNGLEALKLTAAKTGKSLIPIFKNPVTWVIAGTTALFGLIAAYTYFSDTAARSKEAAEKSTKAFKDASEALESINSELKTNQERIDALSSQEHLSFVEQGELERLREVNKELEIQRVQKEHLADLAKGEARQDALDYFNSDATALRYLGWDNSEVTPVGSKIAKGLSHTGKAIEGVYEGNQIEVLEQQLSDYERLLTRKQELEKGISDFIVANPGKYEDLTLQQKDQYDNLVAELNTTNSHIGYLDRSINDSIETVNKFDDSLDLENDSELISSIQKIHDIFIKIFGNKGQDKSQKFDEVWNSESFKGVKKELEEMAKAGTLSPDVLKGNEKYNELLEKTGATAEETSNHIYSLVGAVDDENDKIATTKQQMIESISGMSAGFESLDKIMKSIKDDGNAFDYTLLNEKDFKDTFGNLGHEYEDFIEIVSDSPKDIDKCQNAFNKLVGRWISSLGVLKNVEENTANVTISMLELYGVTNAEELVQAELTVKRNEAALSALDLSNATYEEIAAVRDEIATTDEAKFAINQFYLEKLTANGIALSTDADIKNIMQLVKACGGGITALQAFQDAKKGLVSAGQNLLDPRTMLDPIAGIKAKQDFENALKNYNDILNKSQQEIDNVLRVDYTNVEDTGSKSTDPSGGGGSGSDSKNEEEIDWYEHTIDLLERKRERLAQLGESSSLAYLGLSKEDFEQAKAIIDSTNESMTVSMDDFAILGQLASKAGMDISTFFDEIKNGGNEGRSGYLSALVETDKQALELSRNIANSYLEDYKKAAEQIPEEIRQKIESGGAGVEIFTGDESESVKKAYDLYKKYLDQVDDANEKKQRLYETNRKLYENELSYLDAQAAQIEHRNNMIQKQIDYLNASGQILNASTYEHLILNLKNQQAILDRQIAAKKAEMARMLELGDEGGGYDEGSVGYYEDLEYINSAKESLADLILQQEEYNDTLRQLPVENLQKLVDMYNDITSAIESWGNAYESAGKTLNADYYQVLINNGHQTIAQLKEQADAVRDVMDEYEVGSDKYMEMYNKLQDINSSIAGIVTNQNKWNQSILQLPLDKMSSVIDNLKLMKDALQAVVDEQQNVVSTITEMLDRQREMYEEQQKAEEDVVQKQLDSLNEQLELLEKQNEERDLQLQKEQALYDLHNAQTQKKIQVIRDGELVYEADQDAIRDAQEAVQDADYNIKKHDLELQVEKLEDDLESIGKKYDELYEKLDKIADKWNKIPSDTEYNSNKQLVEQWLGKGWEDKILNSTDEELYEYFKQQFEQNSDSLDKYEDQIETAENIKNLVNTYLTAYRNGTITQEQAMTGIKNVLNGITSELTAGENIKNILNYLASANNTGATTNEILNATQTQLNNAATEMIESMKVYEENSNSIAENMQSFGELTEDISDIRSLIDDVGDNLDDNLSDIRDILEDGFDDLIDALDGYRNRIEDDDEDDEDYGDISNGVIDAGDGNGNHYDPSDYGPGTNNGNDPSWDRERSKHRYAKGIEKGPIATSTMSEKQKALHAMATADLKPDEQPIIAHTGEVVLNKEQQDTVVKNGQRYTKVGLEGLLQSYGIPSTAGLTNFYQSLDIPKPDWNRPSITMQNSTPSKNISVTMGDIHLHEVQNPDGLAKALKNEFPGIAIQEMSKR